MKMKNIISVLAIFAIILSTLSAFSVNQEGQSTETDNDYSGLLLTLNIVTQEDVSNSEQSVTREMFSRYVSNIIRINPDEYEDKRFFKDVPLSNRNIGYINAMNEKGLMIGVGDYEFAPKDNIASNEAAKVLLKAVGYEERYISEKPSLIAEVTKGRYSESVSVRQMMSMIYNVLLMPYMRTTGIKDGESEYMIDKDYTVLEELFGIYVISGRLTAADGCSVTNLGISENELVINNTVYLGDFGYDLIGLYVDAYIEKNTDGEIEKVVYLTESNNTYIDINADDIVSVENDMEIKYSDKSGKVRSVSVNKNVRVFKNGSLINKDLAAEVNIERGCIRIISSRQNGYDIIIVKEYMPFFVNAISKVDKILYSKELSAIEVDESKYNRVKIYDENKKEIDFSSIPDNHLLCIYKSDAAIEIYVCKKMLSGVIECINSENNCQIGGNEYKVDVALINSKPQLFTAGKSGVFYLDCDNRIAYAKPENESDNLYLYVLGVKYDEFDKTLTLRAYTTNGEIEEIETTEIVETDGEKINGDKLYSMLRENDKTIIQLIRVKKNSKGLINFIDTQKYNEGVESEYSLVKILNYSQLLYLPKSDSLGVSVPMNTQTKIINRPAYDIEHATEKDFSTKKIFEGYINYNVEAYSLGADNMFADVVIAEPSEGLMSFPCIFDSLYEAVDDEQNTVQGIKLLTNSGMVEMKLSDDVKVYNKSQQSLSILSEGDAVKYKVNANGEINRIYIMLDIDKDVRVDITNFNRYGNYTVWNTESFGFVKKKQDGIVKYIPYLTDTSGEMIIKAGTSILVYDKDNRNNRLYMGNFDDIQTYENMGEDCSFIIASQRDGASSTLLVYKNSSEMLK